VEGEECEKISEGATFEVAETTIRYNSEHVNDTSSIEDIAVLEKRRCTRILRGMW
jgi:hypothetical protein